MESLARLVNESFARHGVEPFLDCGRLRWSEWFCCNSISNSVFVPGKAGIFALAEEIIAPGEVSATEGKGRLAVFQISETDDLGLVLGRMFLLDRPRRDRPASGRCFARYVVIEDPAQRRSALVALQGITRRSHAELRSEN
jgi:hypothetical protein